MTRLIRILTSTIALVAATFVLRIPPATAQNFDHLTCIRLRDLRGATAPPPMTFTPAQSNFFASTGCEVPTRRARAADLCFPTSQSPSGSPSGQNLGAQDFLCYKLRCKNNGGQQTSFDVLDEFGRGRVYANERIVTKRVCVPAFAPPTAPVPTPTPGGGGPTPTPPGGGGPTPTPIGIGDVGSTVSALIAALGTLIGAVQLLLAGLLPLLSLLPGADGLSSLLNEILQAAQNLLALLQVLLATPPDQQCSLLPEIQGLVAQLLGLVQQLPAVLNPLLANPLLAPLVATAQNLLTLVSTTLTPLLQALLSVQC